MTTLVLITGPLYTDLTVGEVRTVMQGGSKTNVIKGYEDQARTKEIWIHIDAIEYFY